MPVGQRDQPFHCSTRMSAMMLPLRPHRFERNGTIAVWLEPHLHLLPFFDVARMKRIDHF